MVKVYLHFSFCLNTPVLIKVLFAVSNTPRASYHLIHHMVGWYTVENTGCPKSSFLYFISIYFCTIGLRKQII